MTKLIATISQFCELPKNRMECVQYVGQFKKAPTDKLLEFHSAYIQSYPM